MVQDDSTDGRCVIRAGQGTEEYIYIYTDTLLAKVHTAKRNGN